MHLFNLLGSQVDRVFHVNCSIESSNFASLDSGTTNDFTSENAGIGLLENVIATWF